MGAVARFGSWNVSGPAGSAIVSLSYNDFPVSENAADLNELRVVKWNGSTTEWEEQGVSVSVNSTDSIITALVCSSLIGVLFGFIPARNAAQLEPVDALSRD